LPDTVHVALLLDQAGWHGEKALQVPPNITLLPLPPYSPELSPPERVWLHLRERRLSFRLDRSEQAIVDALCAAWNALRAETGRLTSLTSYPWIRHALAQVRN
jgi:transposase